MLPLFQHVVFISTLCWPLGGESQLGANFHKLNGGSMCFGSLLVWFAYATFFCSTSPVYLSGKLIKHILLDFDEYIAWVNLSCQIFTQIHCRHPEGWKCLAPHRRVHHDPSILAACAISHRGVVLMCFGSNVLRVWWTISSWVSSVAMSMEACIVP